MENLFAVLFFLMITSKLQVSSAQDAHTAEPLPAEMGCEADLNATEEVMTFATPNYPNEYPNHVTCAWIIRSRDPDKQVEVMFTPIDTEACCDFIKVRDGDSSASPLILPMSGSKTRSSYFISTYDALFITFSSDDSVTGRGFKVEYRIAEINEQSKCSDEYEASSEPQKLRSPGYPNSYKPNQYCLWKIIAPEGHKVELRFLTYSLETCCDSVLIRDGTGSKAKTIGYVRGRPRVSFLLPAAVYRSTGNIMEIRFRSDSSQQALGFSAEFQSIAYNESTINSTIDSSSTECGGEFEAPTLGHGNFSSPNFPNYHPGDLSCSWVINAPEGERVRVWFAHIETESCCDWIKIRDGGKFDSRKIGVISGNSKKFENFVSSSNVIRIEFDSDATVNRRGFFAYYEIYRPAVDAETSSCGGKLQASKFPQIFSSPNFLHGSFSDATICRWEITSPTNDNIEIQISGLGTLIVYDGLSFLARKLLTSSSSHTVTFQAKGSSNSIMLVLYVRDVTSQARFNGTYRAVPSTTVQHLQSFYNYTTPTMLRDSP